MNAVDIATEKMLLGKEETIVEIFFTLRQIVLDVDPQITENIKWGMPHYDYHGIMCGIGAFKKHVSIWFHRGEQMSNHLNLFAVDGESKKMGQIKYFDLGKIDRNSIQSYVLEALEINKLIKENPKSKTKKKLKKSPTLLSSPILAETLKEDPKANAFFNQMTVAQKNEFIRYIEEAKQESTKERRTERCIERISKGLKTIY